MDFVQTGAVTYYVTQISQPANEHMGSLLVITLVWTDQFKG